VPRFMKCGGSGGLRPSMRLRFEGVDTWADSSGQRNRGERGEDVIWSGIVDAFCPT
jgi:hypothetical protein